MTSRPEAFEPLPAARRSTDHRVFVRDLVLACSIGAHPHERDATQRVRVNIELDVAASAANARDSLANVVDYERVVRATRAIADAGHINLVETLAERIAEACLGDEKVIAARVRVEKLDVFPDVGSVGVELVRRGDPR
ncbi:MAG: dihydroneopterin aldolase [Alphaproteobacteria bacterium]